MFNVREYQQRSRAVQQLEQASEIGGNSATPLNTNQTVLQIALKNDVQKIRSIATLDKRAEYKRNVFIPKWQPHIEDYFLNGEHYQNDVIGYQLIYLFDVLEIEQALTLADKALADGQAMPEDFKRNIPTVVMDSVFKWAETEIATDRAIEPYFSQTLKKAVENQWAVHEFLMAKWLKFAASRLLTVKDKVHAASISEPQRLKMARTLCEIAYDLNHKVGVLSLIERIMMRCNALDEMGVHTGNEPTHKRGEPMESLAKFDFAQLADLLAKPPLSLTEVLEQCSTDEKAKEKEA